MREERTMVLASTDRAKAELDEYCDIREIGQEFRFCRDLYQVRGWATVDVTRRAIEEISLEILKKINFTE